MVAEEWRAVVGYEGKYEVSNSGRVRGVDRIIDRGRRWKGKEIKSKPLNSGHMHIQLTKCCWHLVHRLVLEAFVGPCPDGMEACHNNGNPSDNRVENLRWDTRRGNHADKVKHGTMARGSRNAKAKLTDTDIVQIFRMRQDGSLLSEISSAFKITPANASLILNRKTWRHVEDQK